MKAYYVDDGSESYRTPLVMAESPKVAADLYFDGWVDPVFLVEETENKIVYKHNLSLCFYNPKNPDVPLAEDWQHITFLETDERIFIVNQDA